MAEKSPDSKKITLEIVTPERLFLTQEVAEVTFPGVEGSMGVLPGHVPMVTALKPGVLKFQDDGNEVLYAIGGGYAEITHDKVMILADTAELAVDIDVEAARREKDRALALLKKQVGGAESDQAEISLKKALARLQVNEILRYRKTSGK